MPLKTHSYSNKDLTVTWKPDQCIHSTICWKNLSSVFNPKIRPWINMEAEESAKIREQVLKCPSGALSILETNENNAMQNIDEQKEKVVIDVTVNGPIMIATECMIKHGDGTEEIRTGKTFLCRCGASSKKPYCDGSHKKIDFKG
jgi:uncharacterized Fe-S cluster protein YjdI